MAVTFLDGISINGAATINLDSGDAFTINEPDKDQPGRLVFDYTNGDPTLTIASRASTAKIVVRADTSSTKLTLDENGQIYVNGNNFDGVKIEGTNFHSVGTNTNKLDLGSSTRPWGDIYSTGSYVNTLTLSSIATAAAETVSALFEESGAVVKKDLGTNAFSSTTIPTNAVLTSGDQTVAGIKTFSSNTVFQPSGVGIEVGRWVASSNYGFIGTADMTGSEYCLISDGTNTFIGAGTSGSLKLRGPANDSSPQIVINGSSVTVDDGATVGTGIIRAKYNSSDNTAGLTSTIAVRNGSGSASLTFTIKDGLITSIASSDRRLKENITLIGTSESGINIYTFEYKHKFSLAGVGLFQGVMSDEVPAEAVSVDEYGYDMVDYSLIDVEFKKL
jgi:hypothetical protein